MTGSLERGRRRARAAWRLALAGGAVAAALAVAGALEAERRGRERAVDELLARQLAALGYAPEVEDDPAPGRSGVVLHDPERASPGVNVYCSVKGAEARFVDMDGEVLHSIRLPASGEGADCMLEPLGERSFLALSSPWLSRVEWDSRVSWRARGEHHDVALDADGRIYGFVALRGLLPGGPPDLPVRDHALVRLSPTGEREDHLRLSALLGDRVPAERLAELARLRDRHGVDSVRYRAASDVFHPNTVEVLERDLARGRRGDLLLCVRELDLVAIVDPRRRALVWSFGPGVLDRPHAPSVLPNGNLLIFDNGTHRGHSRLVEVDPATGAIAWEWAGDPPESFFSDVRGFAQALPNGNVLVTESTRGRVFEVTRGGEIVWTFLNPDTGEQGHRRQIYRMFRVSEERFAAWRAPAR